MDKTLLAILSAVVSVGLKIAWDAFASRRRRRHLEKTWLTELSELRSAIGRAEAAGDWTSMAVAAQAERLITLSEVSRLEDIFKKQQARRDILVLYAHLRQYFAELQDAPNIPVTTILTAALEEIPLELSPLAAGTPMKQLEAAKRLLDQLSANHAQGKRVPRRHFDATAVTYLQTAARCFGTSTGGYAHTLAEVESALAQYQRRASTQVLQRLSSAAETAECTISIQSK